MKFVMDKYLHIEYVSIAYIYKIQFDLIVLINAYKYIIALP